MALAVYPIIILQVELLREQGTQNHQKKLVVRLHGVILVFVRILAEEPINHVSIQKAFVINKDSPYVEHETDGSTLNPRRLQNVCELFTDVSVISCSS